MMHKREKAIRMVTSAAMRIVLFDYTKPFDLIGHCILLLNLRSLDKPFEIFCWVGDFLTDRYKKIKTLVPQAILVPKALCEAKSLRGEINERR